MIQLSTFFQSLLRIDPRGRVYFVVATTRKRRLWGFVKYKSSRFNVKIYAIWKPTQLISHNPWEKKGETK